MNFQELKTKINDWFESKSAAERQKMKKYLLVIPGAAIIFLGSMWLIFGSYMSDDGAEKGKANKELLSFLAKRLKTAKSNFEIISGASERCKRILIKGIDAVQAAEILR